MIFSKRAHSQLYYATPSTMHYKISALNSCEKQVHVLTGSILLGKFLQHAKLVKNRKFKNLTISGGLALFIETTDISYLPFDGVLSRVIKTCRIKVRNVFWVQQNELKRNYLFSNLSYLSFSSETSDSEMTVLLNPTF